MPDQDRTDLEVDLLGEAVKITGKRMPNGEVRRRVRLADGTAIHHTVAPPGEAKWQNAHFHKGVVETQVVIAGKMAVARIERDKGWRVCVYERGEVYTSFPSHIHNVYLFPGSVIATITYGEPVGDPNNKGNDWWAADADFDKWSKGLTEADIGCLVA
ncbi:MAG: hypothetical protein Q8Q36_00840 [bacterium]|nr:hypothetical protein [bacterium]